MVVMIEVVKLNGDGETEEKETRMCHNFFIIYLSLE